MLEFINGLPVEDAEKEVGKVIRMGEIVLAMVPLDSPERPEMIWMLEVMRTLHSSLQELIVTQDMDKYEEIRQALIGVVFDTHQP